MFQRKSIKIHKAIPGSKYILRYYLPKNIKKDIKIKFLGFGDTKFMYLDKIIPRLKNMTPKQRYWFKDLETNNIFKGKLCDSTNSIILDYSKFRSNIRITLGVAIFCNPLSEIDIWIEDLTKEFRIWKEKLG